MTGSLECQLRDAAERVYDCRMPRDEAADLMRAAAIEIELLKDRVRATQAERRDGGTR